MIITEDGVCLNCRIKSDCKCRKGDKFCGKCGSKLVTRNLNVPYSIWVIIFKYLWNELWENCPYVACIRTYGKCQLCNRYRISAFSYLCREAYENTYQKGSELLRMMHYKCIDYVDTKFENRDEYMGLNYFQCLNFVDDMIRCISNGTDTIYFFDDMERKIFSSQKNTKTIKILSPNSLEDVLYFNRLENEINLYVSLEYDEEIPIHRRKEKDIVVSFNNEKLFINILFELIDKKYITNIEKLYEKFCDKTFYYRFPRILKCEKCDKISYSDDIYYHSKDLYKMIICEDCATT